VSVTECITCFEQDDLILQKEYFQQMLEDPDVIGELERFRAGHGNCSIATLVRAFAKTEFYLPHKREAKCVEGRYDSPARATSIPQGGPLAFPTQGHRLSPG
jgi:hypothetical protein